MTDLTGDKKQGRFDGMRDTIDARMLKKLRDAG